MNKEKKSQAAIEFLMTYGWMLLVVLIVGALIFSFVDFGSLLPNRIDTSNNIRASATESFATSTPTAGADGDEDVVVVFTYTGPQRVVINATAGGTIEDTNISSELGFECESIRLRNVDTNIEVNSSSSPNGIAFLNGQTGVLYFDCEEALLANDVLQGDIQIGVENVRTQIRTPSTGPLRITIN